MQIYAKQWKGKGDLEIQEHYKFTCLALQDLLCCRELSQAGGTGSVCLDLPAPLPRPGSKHAHPPSVAWEWQGGMVQEEEAEEELRLCSARRQCWLCVRQGCESSGRLAWVQVAPGARVALPLSPCLVGVTAEGTEPHQQHWVNPPTHSHPHPPRKQQTLCASSICDAASSPRASHKFLLPPPTTGSSVDIAMVEDVWFPSQSSRLSWDEREGEFWTLLLAPVPLGISVFCGSGSFNRKPPCFASSHSLCHCPWSPGW